MKKQLLKTLVFTLALGTAAICVNCDGNRFGFGKKDDAVFAGTIETREIRVGSKVGGRVEAVLVEEGQEVTTGQSLVRFDIAELQAQKAQAEARIEQQQARLERLLRGARPEEKAQAKAATETARASLESVKNWPRPEEIEQARASVAAAEADLNNSVVAFQRTEKLRASGDISQQEFDSAKFRLDNVRARRDAEKKRLDLLLNGSRKEDIRAAEEKFRQAQEAERLVLAGPRTEEIADARAQLAEAQARLEQLGTDAQCQHAADHQHREAEQQVHRADVLVVRREQPTAPSVRMPVVMVVRVVAVVVENCAHGDSFSATAVRSNAGYLRAATTSDGCTTCPVMLLQLFLV